MCVSVFMEKFLAGMKFCEIVKERKREHLEIHASLAVRNI